MIAISQPAQPDVTSPLAPATGGPWPCSFCGKRPSQARVIVCGITPGVAICGECIALCAELIADSADSDTPPSE